MQTMIVQSVHDLLGLGLDAGDIGVGQMVLRGVVIYTFTLAIVRLGSKRLLGKATAFDVILGIMIGSVMSRAINGSAGVLPTLAAGSVLVAIHWLFGLVAYRTDWFGHLVKGGPVLLIEDGERLEEALRSSSVSTRDLEEALRLAGRDPDATKLRRAYLERNGEISMIPKQGEPRVVEITVADGIQTVRIEID